MNPTPSAILEARAECERLARENAGFRPVRLGKPAPAYSTYMRLLQIAVMPLDGVAVDREPAAVSPVLRVVS